MADALEASSPRGKARGKRSRIDDGVLEDEEPGKVHRPDPAAVRSISTFSLVACREEVGQV